MPTTTTGPKTAAEMTAGELIVAVNDILDTEIDDADAAWKLRALFAAPAPAQTERERELAEVRWDIVRRIVIMLRRHCDPVLYRDPDDHVIADLLRRERELAAKGGR